MATLRLVAAQINTVVGDLKGNVARITEVLARAEALDADLCVFPELTITGYPPEDLLLKPGFVADNAKALAAVAAASGRCVAVVGFVDEMEIDGRRALLNAAAICSQGRLQATYHKRLLPNYSVFDEQRWFVPGTAPLQLIGIGGVTVGVSICEDVWFDDGPVAALGHLGADLVVNLNAGPYSVGRRAQRLEMLTGRVKEAGCAIAYVNQVGGQDELVFDGNSLILDANGTLVAEGSQFGEDLVVCDLDFGAPTGRAHLELSDLELNDTEFGDVARTRPGIVTTVPEPLGVEAEIYAALVLGTRDYLAKNGFTEAVIALSGGIDSSIVATVAVDALGAQHVHGVSMPSRYSSDGSRDDARDLAERLGIDFRTISIESAHRELSGVLAEGLGHEPKGLTDENLQSRLRGLILMALSNDQGWIVLTTGNKSEMATGYSTLYGDSAGGFAVIKDVGKTLVYRLCRYRNEQALAQGQPPPIPEVVLSKAPSAELRPDQRDDESLPPYDVLDPVLEAYVEQDLTAADLYAAGYAPEVVARVVALVDGAEYKRRQMPPGVRITMKAFGRDRRMPITNRYRSWEES